MPMRIYDGATGLPALGVAPADELDPPYLASAFGNVVPDGAAEGLIERQGYYFKIFLPGPTAGVITPGMAEAADGGARRSDMGAAWDSSNCEIFWCAYAWPVDAGTTGNRVFFINQEGELIKYDNRQRTYEGLRKAPTFGAAYSNATPNNMEEDLDLAIMGFVTNDGNSWTAFGS